MSYTKQARDYERTNRHQSVIACVALVLWALGTTSPCFADPDPLELAVHPVMSEEDTLLRYQPLADYLGQKIGRQVVLRTAPSFFSYWDSIRKPDSYDLILDAAHFTDYRAQKFGYDILAKMPDSISYSLIIRENGDIHGLDDLVGKTVATLGAPSLGATRLAAIFANPARQPIITNVATTNEGIEKLMQGKIHAAFLPSTDIIQAWSRLASVRVIVTTEPIPEAAISASPHLDLSIRKAIQIALLHSAKTDDGRDMLAQLNITGFSPATSQLYAGYSNALKQYWGY